MSGVNEMSLPMRLATVPMANKTARIIWAIMVRGETYRAGHQPALSHNNNDTRLAEEEIGFTRLRERCDVMANRSDRVSRSATHTIGEAFAPCNSATLPHAWPSRGVVSRKKCEGT